MQKNNGFIFWGISLVILVLFVWVIVSLATPNNKPQIINLDINANDIIKGNDTAKYTLLEYSDFQCPACGVYQPLVKKLSEEFPNDLKIVFRNFPLSEIHPNANASAYAAQAANAQGKFWEMADILFSRQADWSTLEKPQEKFISYAQELNLDVEKFKTDMDSATVKDKVSKDRLSAESNNLNSTPTFFVNGQKITNPTSYNEFKNAIFTDQNK